jgi:hypothetical protein
MLYAIAYASAAFDGAEEPPSWEAYWTDYPMAYIRWLRVGYRGMYRWLREGSAS